MKYTGIGWAEGGIEDVGFALSIETSVRSGGGYGLRCKYHPLQVISVSEDEVLPSPRTRRAL